MYMIDYNSYRSIKSFNRRVRFLIMHYTAINFTESVDALTGDYVSAHYLVPDPSEKTYIDAGFDDMRIFNLVDESERAWHAGASFWAGRTNLNDSSIGIEIVNLASEENDQLVFPPFHPQQIEAVRELAVNILQRYPDIEATNVLAHSDIAPGRKKDPGAAFPWKQLYEAGIGAWPDDCTVQKYLSKFSCSLPSKEEILSKLSQYGYDTSLADTDSGYTKLIQAFQLHFRQDNYDGIVDPETTAIIYALVEKYFPADD